MLPDCINTVLLPVHVHTQVLSGPHSWESWESRQLMADDPYRKLPVHSKIDSDTG